ncbi:MULTISPECIES: hypothetical protein [unclassified Acidovorax]|uniref:hypothetical protein n=1 Tax=unclassified Acidovorax TaxID=2684926 RepID=UPI001C487418|nr:MULTISPECIES: hypothetical protein [unclassified Acidovorax]MBV7426740.1 hypothetical protein [Acidovorax sp. sif0732]MBV7447865.1 hypothetical protein [Acidovorax sp. sif0715]
MTTNFKTRSFPLVFVAVLALGAALAGPTTAAAQSSDEASLSRGAVPDTTPQQRYQTAIREAGGGLKVSLEECRAMPSADRRSCESQARATYQADMAKAKAMLRDPSIGPVNVVGGPIRSTETVYEIKR